MGTLADDHVIQWCHEKWHHTYPTFPPTDCRLAGRDMFLISQTAISAARTWMCNKNDFLNIQIIQFVYLVEAWCDDDVTITKPAHFGLLQTTMCNSFLIMYHHVHLHTLITYQCIQFNPNYFQPRNTQLLNNISLYKKCLYTISKYNSLHKLYNTISSLHLSVQYAPCKPTMLCYNICSVYCLVMY